MSSMLNVDKRYLLVPLAAAGCGAALLSVIKFRCNRRKKRENVYETQKSLSLNEYLLFHYGATADVIKHPKHDFSSSLQFPKRCAELCMKFYKADAKIPTRALDVGCSVGRSCFEMTKVFNEVIGVDFSHAFVEACNTMKGQGQIKYEVTREGLIMDEYIASVDSNLDRSKTAFQVGDACNLPLDLGQFGCVLAANLICRLHTPQRFFDRVRSLVAPGGILVITSPYTFMTEYTPEENMIGAVKRKDGSSLSAIDGMKQMLQSHFELIHEEDMPFLIRETARKHQWTVAHATVWLRKDL